MKLTTPRYLASLLFLAALGSQIALAQTRQPADPPPEVKQFQQMEDTWSVAFAHKDQYGMELLLSPTFVNVSAAGEVSTRNQLIAQMFDHSAGDLISIEQRVINVRELGDVALVDGTYVVHYREGAHKIDERGVFTHVYQRTRNSWVCVNAQRTAVFDQADEKARSSSGRKSNAQLPFHIPLVYKGAQSTQPSSAAADNAAPPQ